jgi:penicillin G amidase
LKNMPFPKAKTIKKIFILGSYILLASCVVLALVVALYLRSTVAITAGDAQLTGILSPVEVVRDSNAIPHIYANTIDDAYAALGYVHAQDRLWQMELNRRLPAGRLSELMGKSTLETDQFFRAVGMRRAAEKSLATLDDATKRGLQRYADGVNEFINAPTSNLPMEFAVFGIKPEPWTPLDTVTFGKLMAWDLSYNWRAELMRMRLSQRLDAKQIAQFMPTGSGTALPILPELKQFYADAGLVLPPPAETKTALTQTALRQTALRQTEPAQWIAQAQQLQPDSLGSNNWVVSGERTASGKPLLANDPHLALSAPSIWYFAHLASASSNASPNGGPKQNIVGVTLPGSPFVVLGRNDHIAWGATNTGPDTQDIFIERCVTDCKTAYQTPTGSAPFIKRTETFKVRFAADVVMEQYETRHGPVISGTSKAAEGLIPAGYVLSLGWTGLLDGDTTAAANRAQQLAQDWPSFLEAVKLFTSPQQSTVFADGAGNIGMIAAARVPIRKAANKLHGLAPSPGWNADYDWDGFIPFDELPKTYNPAQQSIATANNKIVGEDYKPILAHEWSVPHRVNRINDLIAATPKHSMASMQALQGDTLSGYAKQMLPLLLAPEPKSPRAAAARQLLKSWDANARAQDAAPLIFAQWMRELTKRIYADELGTDLFDRAWDQRAVFMFNTLTENAAGGWCDNVNTKPTETCTTQVAEALDEAVAQLQAQYGVDMDKWAWGRAHVALSEHRPFAQFGSMFEYFNIRRAVPGDSFTVNVGGYRIANKTAPFAANHAASMRAIYDFSDLENSAFMHSTGQSGNRFSPYYDSMADRWAANQMLQIPTAREKVQTSQIGTIKFTPKIAVTAQK